MLLNCDYKKLIAKHILWLCHFRLLESDSIELTQQQVTSPHKVLQFSTRTGTKQGVESHVFRAETQVDLSVWTRSLVQASHTAAILLKEVSYGKNPCK